MTKAVIRNPLCNCRGEICGKQLGERVVIGGQVLSEVFRCAGCKRRVPWCFGAHDAMPDHCDDCWAATRQEEP